MKNIGIGLMGFGVIGGKVAQVLIERAEKLSQQVGCPVALKKIKVAPTDMAKPQIAEIGRSYFTTDDDEFFDDPEINIVVEAIGGEHPAFEYLSRALSCGRHAVTSNKELIAKHGLELRSIAQQNNVSLRYEASVGGGIPLITPLRFELTANKIERIYAIINGTTNYILTRMEKDGIEFARALKQAQKLGYAEANPENDIEGIDATYKLAIMSSLITQQWVQPGKIHHEGISKLNLMDFQYARELGFAIKLLAICKNEGPAVEVRVHPAFIPEDSLLAGVNDVYNGVLVEGDLLGRAMFYGEGAGPNATSSAVVADILAEAGDICRNCGSRASWQMQPEANVKPMADIETRYYLRMIIADRAGVLSQISKALGDNRISIASVIQKETDSTAKTAEVVLMTHRAHEKAMQQALTQIEQLSVVKRIGSFIRVEDKEKVK